jgi:hypothetical protein
MRAFVALVMVVALAAPARAIVIWKAFVGRNFSGGGGSSHTSDGGDPPVEAGGDYTFSRGGAYCPDPNSDDYVCASYYSYAGLVGNRIVLKSSATMTRTKAVGLGYGNSDYLVYGDTEVEIINLGSTNLAVGTGIVYFVFGLHGVASTVKTSSEVLTMATGVATLTANSVNGLQCTGDPCPPIRVRVPGITFAPNSDSVYNYHRINLRADARAGAPVGFPYEAEMIADFGSTLELLAIEIHDDDDNPVPGAQATILDSQGQVMLTYPNTYETTTTTLVTSTTIPGGGTTTTTTLPGAGCAQGPSYPGLTCRVAALQALLAQSDVDKLAKPLAKALDKAATAITQAEQTVGGPPKKHGKALKKATKAMNAFGKKLASKGAVKKIDETTRAALSAPVAGIVGDLAGLSAP